MPVSLHDAMRETLKGWQNDLPAPWRAIMKNVELGFVGVDTSLTIEPWEPIFPSRRGRTFPGAPPGSHMFRMFDGLDPECVRCVVLGQDPYPEPGFATGRAFEAGNVAAWSELDKMFSKSVRAFMQMICAARTGDESLAASFDDWPRLLAAITSGRIELESPGLIADRWVGEGVLLLNSSLTISRFAVEVDQHQSHGHLPIWRPFVVRILEHLASSERPVVFLGFGDVAADNLTRAGLVHPPPHQVSVLREHPAFAERVLGLPNPFTECNAHLESVGQEPIAW